MPLVEVIRGKKTSDATIATAVAYARTLGKSPIVMNDGPGFLVNRLLLPYMNEAALLLCEGAEHQGDRTRRPSHSACRWGRSRCTTWWASTSPCTPAARWSRRFPIASCRRRSCRQLVERGRLGQKVGNGFFDYGPAKGGKPPRGTDSAEVAQLIDECRTGAAAKVLARRTHRSPVPADAASKRRACSKTASCATSATSTSA